MGKFEQSFNESVFISFCKIVNNYWARLSKKSWDTDKSRHFAITEFDNCFIIRTPFFVLTKYVQSLSAWSDPPSSHQSVVSIMHEQNITCSKTLITRQLFADHVVSSRSMTRKEKIHRMIIDITWCKQFEVLFHFISSACWLVSDCLCLLGSKVSQTMQNMHTPVSVTRYESHILLVSLQVLCQS